MSQFRVYRNAGANSAHIPYLLDIQNELLEGLETRMVIPLIRESSFNGSGISTLTPKVEINGEALFLLTPQMTSVSRRLLVDEAYDLSDFRYEILAAVNLLVIGF